MNELKPEDVTRALELHIQRHLMPNVDVDGTVSVEDAERWFLKLLKEQLAPYISALLREKDARIMKLELTLQGVMWSVDKWLDEADYDQDQVKRAIKMREKTLRIVEEKDAEIERLQNGLAISKKETKRYITSYKQTHAEAIREFAERLKAQAIPVTGGRGFEGVNRMATNLLIDKIAKEMKGETDGKTDL